MTHGIPLISPCKPGKQSCCGPQQLRLRTNFFIIYKENAWQREQTKHGNLRRQKRGNFPEGAEGKRSPNVTQTCVCSAGALATTKGAAKRITRSWRRRAQGSRQKDAGRLTCVNNTHTTRCTQPRQTLPVTPAIHHNVARSNVNRRRRRRARRRRRRTRPWLRLQPDWLSQAPALGPWRNA